MTKQLDPEVAARQAVERQIVERVVDDALAAGFLLSVDNGGYDFEILLSSDRTAVLAEMFATDEEYLYLYRKNQQYAGSVYLVYGNDGWDVICDHSVALTDLLAGASALADELEEKNS